MTMHTEGDAEELERICFNCNNFFPLSMGEPTALGICLNDTVFEPYIDELLEKQNFDCCRDLIENKKFTGENSSCNDFSEVERIYIDDNSELGQQFRCAMSERSLTVERMNDILLTHYVSHIEWKDVPVEDQVRKLKSNDSGERDAAISSLGGLIAFGNEKAFQELYDFLVNLPPPCTLEEVRLKMNLLSKLWQSDKKELFLVVLINELQNTPSNNTTRQWISEVLKHLSLFPREHLKEPLEKMSSDTGFSYKLRKRIRELLYS